uniref:Cell wall protein DAN4-like n=1 Tax=Geotrypetes seraphini TaxID=260995 RepID=A0A6P8S412_GEOSA|nr:cell wall protein DAN4-like [Geotrypetes seraphini]
MSLGAMKPCGAAVLCFAVANVLCLAGANDADPNYLSEAPSAVTSLTTTTVSSDNAEPTGNDLSSSEYNTSEAKTTTSQPIISVTANGTETESSTANKTDADERGNDTTTGVYVSATTTASQFTTHKLENGSSTANEADASERDSTANETDASKSPENTFIDMHNELLVSTTASRSTTPVADNKPENGSSTTSGSKSGQTTSFPSGSNIILPVFIPLGLVLFLAVTIVLYKMCKKTPPGDESQNAAEKPASKNESVKLLSVKTSPEAEEHSSQRRNKALQNDDSSPHLDHKYI